MAEVDFDEFEDAVYAPIRRGARSEQVQRLMNYAGAASSVALVILLAVWGWKLAMRDVNGVPVMRALAGPMRVMPDDPGGQEASNQGLSVNAVASTGIASPVPDKVVLAPAATALTGDDRPGLAGPVGAAAPTAAVSASAAATPEVQAAPADPVASAADAVNAAVAEALAADGAVAPVAGSLSRSLVPHARPGAATASAATPAAAEIDPATIAIGTELAQLGAYDSPEEARAKWEGLAALYSEVMAGKSLVIQPAQSGGKDFFRLRAAGFAGEDDARRFCAVLLAGNADCIPVAQR